MHLIQLLPLFLLLIAPSPQDKSPPSGSKLTKLVKRYIESDHKERKAIRKDCDAMYKFLKKGNLLKKYRKDILKTALKEGSRISFKGTNFFYEDNKIGKSKERKGKGKYIAKGKGKTLFIGLHGGGVGSGSAESSAGSMGGGGFTWIFPEVLGKTECGWTTSGTEEFIIDLIKAAKRTGRIDPNKIYITGHSMGGYGSWTLGAHHADLFGGAAAYAGAPTPYFRSPEDQTVVGIVTGVIPSLFNLPLFVFQSTDDPQVPPEPNDYAVKELEEIKKKHPDGFNFRYMRVENRGHSAPKEGYLPSQQWVASHLRNARPKKILWQPVLSWKKQFYWLYWEDPILESLIQAEVTQENVIEIKAVLDKKVLTKKDLKGFSLLIGPPLIDIEKKVKVKLNGQEIFSGLVDRTLSTLLLTAPACDEDLLYDARIDLKSN